MFLTFIVYQKTLFYFFFGGGVLTKLSVLLHRTFPNHFSKTNIKQQYRGKQWFLALSFKK